MFPQKRKRGEDALSFAGLGASRGDRAGTSERVEQPGGDGPLHPAVLGADSGGIADQRPQDDGERGEADGEGHDKPGVDQPERYNAAERRYHRDGGQQHAGGRGARVGGAGDDAADGVPGTEVGVAVSVGGPLAACLG